MFTTVLFDLDDTLHDDAFALHAATRDVSIEVCRGRNISPDKLAEAFIEQLETFWQHLNAKSLHPGTNVRQQMWAEALQRFGIDDNPLADNCARDFESRRKSYYSLFPETETTLAALRAEGLRLAMLTNGLKATHHEKIEMLGLAPYFTAIFLSDEIGVSKPHPGAFLHACEQMGVSPSETVMVGDRYDKDIAGAINVGMAAIWFNPKKYDLPPGQPKPHAVVSSIGEVPSALRALLGRV